MSLNTHARFNCPIPKPLVDWGNGGKSILITMSSLLVAFSVALTCQRLLVLLYLLNSFKATGFFPSSIIYWNKFNYIFPFNCLRKI